MKKIGVLLTLAITIIASGCSNGELEKRVSDLERRVAALEGNAGNASVNKKLQSVNANNTTQQDPNTTPKTKPEGPLPEIKFNKTSHDFGTITEGDVVSHVFQFENTGEAPLIISNASSSCGCTIPSYPKNEPIAPGETAEIKVQYNSRGKKNQDSKIVRITANTWPATTTLNIKAFVEPKAQ